MNTSDKNTPPKDPIDRLIFESGLRIEDVFFNLPLDLMIILLNNKKVMKRSISDFKLLQAATIHQLKKVENDGVGLHWEELDEDLSLRGFLKYEIANTDNPKVA